MRLPRRPSALTVSGVPVFAIKRDLNWNSLVENAICCMRFSVIAIDEMIASILRACSAGIMPENSISTHWQCMAIRRQISLARSTSKPVTVPSGIFTSMGGYVGSIPRRNTFASFAKAGVDTVKAAITAAASNEERDFIGAYSVVKTLMVITRLHGTSAKCHQTGPIYLS